MRVFVILLLSLAPWPGRAEDVHPITHRRIAQVMGVGGADWLVRPEREAEEHPDEALDLLKIPKGAVAADIGAGVGYFTWRLAERVGPSGVVYGEDIQPQMIDLLNKNMRDRKIGNVRTVLGAVDDPKLPKESLDLVLLEYRAEDPAVPIRPEHKMTVKQVRAEVEPEGFRFDRSIEKLPEQHIIV